MNYFAPGLRELARILDRLVLRLRFMLARRKLAKLEIALGLLGWQQAEYDRVTQKHVDRLRDFEHEQLRLTNESAALSLEIQELEKERGVRKQEFEQKHARMIEEAQPTAVSATAVEEQAAAKRKERKEHDARLAVLDRELGAAEAAYRRLVVNSASQPEDRDAILRLRKVILAIPRERAEWQSKLEQVAEQLRALEALLDALRKARERFEKEDGELVDEIAARRRKKREVEKEIDAFEKAKARPYREIGRALADHDIFPLNQPESLAAVQAQRVIVSAGESAIAASLKASCGEDRAAVRKSWLLAGALMLLGAIVVCVAARMLF